MADFGEFLKRYRRRIDEEDGGEPSNGVGPAIAKPEAGGYAFVRRMQGNHPHYTVEDDVYRNIRRGKKKFSRWDKFIDNPELRDAVRGCMAEFGQVTVESRVSGQAVRLKK